MLVLFWIMFVIVYLVMGILVAYLAFKIGMEIDKGDAAEITIIWPLFVAMGVFMFLIFKALPFLVSKTFGIELIDCVDSIEY